MKKITNIKKIFSLSKPMNLDVMRPKNFHKNLATELNKINQNVEKKSRWIAVNNCPVCGSKSYLDWLVKCGNEIRRCKICTHGYAHRQAKKISEVYDSFTENEKKVAETIKSYKAKRNYRIKRFATERVNLLKKFKQQGKLLDFGCGEGWFLEYAKKYYNVAGYEPTTSLAKSTSQNLKIKVELNHNKFKSKSFDIITSFDVIEHVPKPKETFQVYSRLLKKGGILLIYTPNANSIAFEYMKEKQNLVSPPIHLHYFNKKSIELLGDKKFSLIYFETAGLDVGDMYAYERDQGNKKFANFLYKKSQILQSFCDYTNSGNHLRAIFKKN